MAAGVVSDLLPVSGAAVVLTSVMPAVSSASSPVSAADSLLVVSEATASLVVTLAPLTVPTMSVVMGSSPRVAGSMKRGS